MSTPGTTDPASGAAPLGAGGQSGSPETDGPVLLPLGGAPARFLLATAISSYGNWLSTVAIVVVLFQSTGSVVAAAGYTVARLAPRLFGAGLGGALSDRFSPSRFIVVGSAVQGALTAALVVCVELRMTWPVYVLVGASQLMGSATTPATPAVIAQLFTSDRRRHRANAVWGAGISSSILVAPALGSLLLAIITPAWLIAIDSLTFGAVICLMIGIRTHGASERGAVSIRGGLVLGAQLLGSWHALRAFGIVFMAGPFALAATQAVLAAAAVEHFGGARNVGWLYTGVGAGSLVGAVVAGRYHVPVLTARRVLLCFVGEMAGLVLFAVVPSLAFAVTVLALGAVCSVLYQTWGISEMQRLVPADSLGRAFGALWQALNIGLFFGAIAGVLLITAIRWQLVVAAAVSVATLVGFVGSLVRPSTDDFEVPREGLGIQL